MRWLLLGLLVGCRDEPRVYTLDELPVAEWTAGLPVEGDGALEVALTSTADWREARGRVDFRCDHCTLGDDRVKLKVGGWVGDVAFGQLTLQRVRARAVFGDGRVRVRAEVRSAEVELDAVVHGALASRADDIELDGCVAFRVHDTLRDRDPRLHAALTVTGAPAVDGRYFISLRGTLGKMRKLGERCELRLR